MGGCTVEGHPYVEEKNAASKGVKKDMNLGGGGKFATLTHALSSKHIKSAKMKKMGK